MPAIDSYTIPEEQIIASGRGADIVLARRDDGAEHIATAVFAMPGAVVPKLVELFRTRADEWGEASIAAGEDGFVVVRDGPTINQLQLIRLDVKGDRVGDPVIIMTRGDVSRYPRVAALESVWIVSYWEGIGPTIVRLDADARPIGDPIAVRSGDERVGQTDARIAISANAIAISWLVASPMMDHGTRAEEPSHPGPRLAVLRCEP